MWSIKVKPYKGIRGKILACLERELHYRHLQNLLDDICEKIAKAFGLLDSHGRPRKALILTELLKHSYLICITKNPALLSKEKHVNAIYLENHRFAMNFLTKRLRNFPNVQSRVHLQNEVLGEHGCVGLLILCEIELLKQLQAIRRAE